MLWRESESKLETVKKSHSERVLNLNPTTFIYWHDGRQYCSRSSNSTAVWLCQTTSQHFTALVVRSKGSEFTSSLYC